MNTGKKRNRAARFLAAMVAMFTLVISLSDDCFAQIRVKGKKMSLYEAVKQIE